MKKIRIDILFLVVSLSSCHHSSPAKENYYTVTWKNYDGTILRVDNNVHEGELLQYEGYIPERVDDYYNYTFSNWVPEIHRIYENSVYLASFTKKAKELTLSFSHESGFYNNELNLSIEPSIINTEIYYTLDGSTPSKDSIRYEEPIIIKDNSNNPNIISQYKGISSLDDVYYPDYLLDKCICINAIAYNSELNTYSDVYHQTYWVGYDSKPGYDNMPIISLSLDEDDLFDYEKGIYVTGKIYDESEHAGYPETYPANYNQRGKEWERRAFFTYLDNKHNYQYTQPIGIRIHGGWSRAFNQKSFNLYARKEYSGTKTFEKPFFGDVAERTIMLRSGGYRDTFITKTRDSFNHDMVDNEPFANQKSFPVVLFLNGEYWGIYNLQERFSEDYLEKYYGIDKDNVLIIENDEIDEGDKEDIQLYQDLIDYFTNNNFEGETSYNDAITNYIDVDSFLSYISTELYVGNIDWPGNNVRLWRDKNTQGDSRWRFMMYDTDDSSNILSYKCDYDSDPFDNITHWKYGPLDNRCVVGLIFTKLLANQTFKSKFISTIKRIGSENFNSERVNKYLDGKVSLLKTPMKYNYMRFVSIDKDEEYFINNISIIKEFFSKRYESILEKLENHFGN